MEHFRKIKKWLDYSEQESYKKSYSQSGEDMIVNYLFTIMGTENPTYIDIGTNDPKILNNTFFFYEKGYRGICIEPDPELFKKISKIRNGDICINAGVSATNSSDATFYVMTAKTLSTFSKEEAESYTKSNSYGQQKIESEIKIPLININELFEKHTKGKVNFMSLDIEGLDKEILEAFDFAKYAPDALCLETVRCLDKRVMKKDIDLIDFIKGKGYMVYADTSINTIFIRKELWNKKYEEII